MPTVPEPLPSTLNIRQAVAELKSAKVMDWPVIALSLWLLAGCNTPILPRPSAPTPLGSLPGDTVLIEGRVLAAVSGKENLWFQSEPSQRIQYKTELDVRIESPETLAGLCQRFAFYTEHPVSPGDWRGKRIAISVSKVDAFKMIFFVRPEQIHQ